MPGVHIKSKRMWRMEEGNPVPRYPYNKPGYKDDYSTRHPEKYALRTSADVAKSDLRDMGRDAAAVVKGIRNWVRRTFSDDDEDEIESED